MKRLGIIGLHAAYWGTYLILLLLFVLMLWLQTHHVLHRSFWQRAGYWPGWILLTLPQVVSFYVFYGVLFPRFLKTKRLLLLVSSGLGVTILSSLLGLMVSGLIYNFRFGPHLGFDSVMEGLVLSVVCFIHGALALVIKGFISWYEDIHLKERLNRKNYEMELALIKSQLNPHFLFNTLNNIDVLIQKDAGRASVYLNQLSDILRFMLYETKNEQIPIQQELQYIDKYIQLQKIRMSHPEYISYSVEGPVTNRLVAPMLFIPFIENAFKHAEKKVDNAISVRFIFLRDTITFVCENRYNTPRAPGVGGANGDRESGGGLGNDLIRRRLSLLYPDRHQLDISTIGNIYKATLTLNYAN
jgi:two-component system LytT family sensor kinase